MLFKSSCLFSSYTSVCVVYRIYGFFYYLNNNLFIYFYRHIKHLSPDRFNNIDRTIVQARNKEQSRSLPRIPIAVCYFCFVVNKLYALSSFFQRSGITISQGVGKELCFLLKIFSTFVSFLCLYSTFGRLCRCYCICGVGRSGDNLLVWFFALF